MNILLALKLTSDSNMISDTISIRNVSDVEELHLLTDVRYKTEVNNVEYHYLPKYLASIPFIRLCCRIPAMLTICKNNEIDLLICYHLTFGIAGLIVSKIMGIPISMHFLGLDLDVLCRKKYFGNILLWISSKMDLLTVQGQNSKMFLKANGIENVSIIPTVCDFHKFHKINSSKKYDLIFVGRLSKEKRPDRFIQIVSQIADKKSDIRAVILGSGPLEVKVLRQIKSFNLENNIELIGWTNDVIDFLNNSKLFILTSDNDQLPLALLEAMASGLVPVASNVGNVSDVVNEKNGFLIDQSDLEGFTSHILELLHSEDDHKRKSEESIRFISKYYSIESNTKRWSNILNIFNKGG